MIPFTCPKCGTELEVPSSEAGKKVACPDCGTRLLVTAPTKKASGASSTTTRRAEGKGPGSSISRRTEGKASPRSDAKMKRRPRDDEDDEDEAPRNKKKKNKKGSSSGMLIGLGVGGGVLVVGAVVVVIAVLMSGKGKDKDDKVATTSPPVSPMGTNMSGQTGATAKETAPATESTTKTDEQTTKPEKDDPPVPAGGVSDDKIYNYLLNSTALVIQPVAGGYEMGTGSIIDKTNRLILTNYHVVLDAREVFILFPGYDKNHRLLTNRESFLEHAKGSDALTGKVVARYPSVDLALVQVEKVPDSARALPFAAKEPSPGTHVISMGHPGTSGLLWVLTVGTVKQLTPKFHWQSTDSEHTHLFDCTSDIVLTDSPTNPGDSGGPLVNNRGEMVAVVHGAHTSARGLSLFIDITEVKGVVNGYAQSSGVKLALAERGAGADEDRENLPRLLRALAHKDAEKRADAARNLGAMGPDAQSAVPGLLKLLDDPDDVVRKMSLEALLKIGPPAVGDLQAVIGALKSQNPQVRLYAAGALAKTGPDARSAVDPLLEALKDKDPALRRAAAQALGAVGLDAKEQVQPALVEAMKDPDASVRGAAAAALPVLPMSPADVPLLVGLLKNPDAAVRAGAARALAKTGAEAKVTMKPLADGLHDGSAPVRQAALEALGRYGADAKDYVPAMARALRDPNVGVQQAAAEALGDVGPDAKSAAKALAEAAQAPELRKSAITALARIGPAAAHDAGPMLVNMLNVANPDDRLLALTALAGLKPSGAEAKDLVPKLIRAFEDRDPRIRAQAAATLGQFGKPAVPSLVAALNDPNRNVRAGAVTSLGNIGSAAGPQARNAVALLSQVDRDQEVQKACASAMAAMQR